MVSLRDTRPVAMASMLATIALALFSCAHGRARVRTPRPPPERFADLANRPAPRIDIPKQGAVEPRNDNVVARLEVVAPKHSPFVVHGTIPVPSGVYPQPDGSSPLSVISHAPDRPLVPAQVEVVSRYPKGDADVVEILALVERAPSERPGRRLRFDVVLERCDDPEGPDVGGAVQALMDLRGAPLLLRTEDVFGNVYAVDLRGRDGSKGFGSRRVLKSGVACRQTRTYGTLSVLERSEAGNALPHLMGVHAYLTEWAGDERVSLDLRLNNGATAGSQKHTRAEVPLGIVYWKSLELVLPPGWTARPFAPDPFFGKPYDEDGLTVIPIVRANEDGSLHMMGPQAQFQRRLTLVPAAVAGESDSHAALDGLGFATADAALWSWYAPRTARYLPQRGLLARWTMYQRGDLRGKTGLHGRLSEEYTQLSRLVRDGKGNGNSVVAEVMGWAHPWFIKAQGGVGGQGIQIYAGHRTAAAASVRGFARLMLVHRMNASRQPDAQWNRFGDAVGYHEWMNDVDRVPFDFRTNGRMVPPIFKLPMFDGPPASEHVAEVHRRGLRPRYDQGSVHTKGGELPSRDDNILAWMPHDGQHFVRWTRPAQALVWLGNDSLAKDDVIHAAELFHLMFHESSHSREEWSDGVTLLQFEKHAARHPHEGGHMGRDQAWGIDAMCAAYSVASEEWRRKNEKWFERVARVMVKVATPSGIIMRNPNTKLLGHSRYGAAYAYQSLFLLHAMRCLSESVLRGTNDVLRGELEDVYLRAIDYMFWEPIYAQDLSRYQPKGRDKPLYVCGPRWAFAVGLNDGYKEPPFSEVTRWGKDYLPEDGKSGGVEFFHCWSALEYAMLISPPKLGFGLDNRYLRRSLACWTRPGEWAALQRALFTDAAKPSTDNSGNWVGFVGRLQALGK